MPYYIEFPKQYDEEYLKTIDITEFVDAFKNYKKTVKKYLSDAIFQKYFIFYKFGYKIEEVINFINDTEQLRDTISYKYHDHEKKYLDKIIQIFPKYEQLLRNYTDTNLVANELTIVMIKDNQIINKFKNFFELVNGSVICQPENSNRIPFWIDYLPYPDFGGDEMGIFLQETLSDFYHNIGSYMGRFSNRFKSKNIILVLNNETYYVVTGRTES